MTKVIVVHGCCTEREFFDEKTPSPSNNHWIPWIQKKLLMQGIAVQTPEMPNAYNPDYETWKTVFDQFTVDLETVLVAHSCGAGFLLRWLGETRRPVAKLILVAPWLDQIGREGCS